LPAIRLLILALYVCACGLFVVFVFAYLSSLFFPSSFFRLTFSSISSSISYLPEYGPVSRPEVVGGDRTWV